MAGAIVPLVESGAIEIDPASTLDHMLMGILGGGTTGVVGGFVSGWPLSRLLISAEATMTLH